MDEKSVIRMELRSFFIFCMLQIAFYTVLCYNVAKHDISIFHATSVASNYLLSFLRNLNALKTQFKQSRGIRKMDRSSCVLQQRRKMFMQRRIVEELNLMDDFLFFKMVNDPDFGEEFSRELLRIILGKEVGKLKVVPQKVYYGSELETHGARLDVYLEEENVLVIFIMSHDPFSRNRMVYTVANRCLEELELPYDDGARTLFLYTKGTEGNPRKELQELLKYMENSSSENVTNDSLKKIHQMTRVVKSNKEPSNKRLKVQDCFLSMVLIFNLSEILLRY